MVRMVGDSSPYLVQAIYSFKGKNNDELCFKKGDIITVTQREEGGWWEGTLGEKTGWFPSNYVKEYKPQDGTASLAVVTTSPTKSPPELASQQKMYRNVVLKDIIDSEKANVSELQSLLKNFLHPLEKSDILTRDEYRQLVGNIGHVLETHQQLLAALEDCYQRAPSEQRVGKVFLTSAPRIKQVHQAYCTSHPKAVCILDKYKDELNAFMESQEAASPGLLVLTTGLSKPFRRLEKYAGMLQELERHIEENHPDRGDTQRSVSVYKDIASACSGTRRQKELELEVLTGGVRGWEGEDLSCLGEVIHMGSVAVGPDHRDRYLVLFPSTLLILSVSQRMSAFIYEGKLPLTGINVNKLEDSDAYKNAFEIIGPMIERIVAVCQTREDQASWVDMLKRHIRVVASSPAVSPPPQPLPPPHVSAHPFATLTAYFADLIARGLINRSVLKQLLYAQYEKGLDLFSVKVRHSHKVECTVFPTRVSKTTLTYVKSSDTNSSSNRSGTLKRQNAVDIDDDSSSCGSCASNPFGFIRVYPNDHVESIKCFGDDVSSQCENKVGSKTSNHGIELEHCQKNDVTCKPAYISQASISINCSDSETRPYLKAIAALPSDESSFERSSAHQAFTYAASTCQDLAHLDDIVAETKSSQHEHLAKKSSREIRQSLPTTFSRQMSNDIRSKPLVPPKPLALCAPAFRSASVKDLLTTCRGAHLNPRNQVCHSVPALSRTDDSQSTPTTLSSNLDIPINMIRVPSAMFAELLYGQASQSNPRATILDFLHQESVSSDHSTRTIQTVHESTHSIPKKSSCSWEGSSGDIQRLSRQNLPCNSFSCRHSGTHPFPHNISGRCSDHGYCRCCSDAPLPYSTRSSDSGLADITGNSALPSPDLSSPLPEPGSPEASNCSFLPPSHIPCEAHCTCTHSLSSTPRTSAQPSLTSDIIYAGSSESVPSVTSLCLDMCSPWWPRDDEILCPVSSWQLQDQSCYSNEGNNITPLPSTQSTETEHLFLERCTESPREEVIDVRPCKRQEEDHQSVPEEKQEERMVTDAPHPTEDHENQEASSREGSPVEQHRIFRSGMYAHWWLKAKIPASALMMSSSPPPQTDVIPERSSVSQSESTTSECHAAN